MSRAVAIGQAYATDKTTFGLGSACEEFLDLDAKVERTERLGHEGIGPTACGTISHLRLGVGSEDEDLEVGRLGILTKMSENFPAIEARQSDVEDDCIGSLLTDSVESLGTVAG